MRIGLLTDMYRPGISGVVNFVVAYKSALEKLREEVHPLTSIEAFSTELPVLGMSVPGVADVIAGGIRGCLTYVIMSSYARAMGSLALLAVSCIGGVLIFDREWALL